LRTRAGSRRAVDYRDETVGRSSLGLALLIPATIASAITRCAVSLGCASTSTLEEFISLLSMKFETPREFYKNNSVSTGIEQVQTAKKSFTFR
jgi:hypothetical protein